MTIAGVAGFAPRDRYERRTWTLEDCAAVRVGRDPPPDGVELVLMWRGCVLQRAFRCPTCTGPLRRALYDPDGEGWRCRVCCRAEHASRFRDADPLARVATLRARLGAEADLAAPLPPRPRGMRRKVYARRVAKLIAAEARALRHVRAMHRGLTQYVERIERRASAGG